MNDRHKWVGRAIGAAALAGSLGACDFITATDRDPNAVPSATTDQLFVTSQVGSYFLTESGLTRTISMWLQQMAGIGSQYADTEKFDNPVQEDEFDAEFSYLYTRGGLATIRLGIASAEADGETAYAGMFRVHEAYMMGMGASIWGDLPYSEAVTVGIDNPKLDEQAAVYARVQAVLDTAITNLGTAHKAGPGGGVDFNFGGDRARWVAVANTLKARFYMHWVEAQAAGGQFAANANIACGGNCLDKAIAAADKGVKTSAGSWLTRHAGGADERNLFHRFAFVDRPGYWGAGKFGVDLLTSRGDPRLPLYYSRGSGANADTIIGSAPGTPTGDVSDNASLVGPAYGGESSSVPIASCAENYFILAEAHFRKGATGLAQTNLRSGVACEEARLSVSNIPVNATLTGDALLNEIMLQKYLALFLNLEAYNDYKRTCRPTGLISNADVQVAEMFRRVPYGQTERQTNPNIPVPDQQPLFNDNDPAGCGA